jgi:oligo-1,6-glucosidase
MKKILFAWQKEVDWNANYLENHDQHRSLERFGDTGKYWKESATMLATLLMTLRGTPYIYQGEEIGMLNYPMFTPEKYKDPVNTYIYNLLRHYHISRRLAMKWVQNFNRDGALELLCNGQALLKRVSPASKSTWLPVQSEVSEHQRRSRKGKTPLRFQFLQKNPRLPDGDPILCYGDFRRNGTSGDVMAYFRSYDGHIEFVLLNMSGKKQMLPSSHPGNAGRGLAFELRWRRIHLQKVLAALTKP